MIFHARVVGKVEFDVFGHRDPVIRIHRLVRDNLDPRSRDAPLVIIDDEELLKEGLVKKKVRSELHRHNRCDPERQSDIVE